MPSSATIRYSTAPYGPRPVVYADYTASRPIARRSSRTSSATQVLPLVRQHPHRDPGTGLQTTRFREDARGIIRDARRRRRRRPCVSSAARVRRRRSTSSSTSSTCASRPTSTPLRPRGADPRSERPVVFVGPYEHHSNELPWRESIADVVAIAEDSDGPRRPGRPASAQLGRVRRSAAADRSFSAASNVTGIVTDTRPVARAPAPARRARRSGTSPPRRRTSRSR